MSRYHLSARLAVYLGWRWLVSCLIFIVLLLLLILLIETLDSFRRATGRADISLGTIIYLGWLKLPLVWGKIGFFAILYNSVFRFWYWNRTRDLIIIQAMGVSIWQLLTPLIGLALSLGVISILVIQPATSEQLTRYQSLEGQYFSHQPIEQVRYRVWFRQRFEGDTWLFYARSLHLDTMELRDVSIWRLGEHRHYEARWDAQRAVLLPGSWELQQGRLAGINYHPPESFSSYLIPTRITREDRADVFAPVETISFWRLPVVIERLEQLGLPTGQHRLGYQLLLVRPVLFATMVLLGAAFCLPLRTTRGNQMGLMIALSIGLSFVLFVLSDIVGTLGVADVVPIGLAAWVPVLVTGLATLTALLYLEEG